MARVGDAGGEFGSRIQRWQSPRPEHLPGARYRWRMDSRETRCRLARCFRAKHATDTFAWTVAGTAPPQISEPAYLWGNTWNGSSPVAINIRNGSSAWIVANRDYYNHAIPFNGTSGVGVGTLASRPATCTAGVAYWATDQGKWNSTTTGPDGQLYKCTATNTWSLYYIPYTYPHPLRSSSSLPPPTNLRVM